MSDDKIELSKLKARSKKALGSRWQKELVGVARGMTPNGAYNAARDLMYVKTGDFKLAEKLAKSCRFLAIILRDYGPDTFEALVSSQTTTSSRPDKGTNKKGVKSYGTKA